MPQFVSSATFNPASLQADDLYVVVIPPPSFVQGLPADILAIVGTSNWGPLNQPTLMGSPADLLRQLGAMSAQSVTDPFDLPTSVMVAFQQSQSPSSLQILGVRVSDGTDIAATFSLLDTTTVTPLVGLILSGLWTGSLGNQIEVTIAPGNQPNTYNVTVIPFAGASPEIYPNIKGSTGASSTFWVNLMNAINNGVSGVRGPSLLLKASTASTTAKPPAIGTFTLSGGTDGRMVTSANLLGSDATLPKTGLYSLRSMAQPPGLVFISGLTDSTVYAAIQAFADSEGIVAVLCLEPNITTTAAITAMQGLGIQDYNVIFVKDWITWFDSTNNTTRQIQPSPFIGGSICCLRPDISPSNKPVFGVVGTERQGPQIGNIPYSETEIGQLESAGILFITNPCPGGSYFGMRHGRNSSSNVVTSPIEYARMTNFLGHTLQHSLGNFVGVNQTDSPTDQTRGAIKAELDDFLQDLEDLGMIDSYLTICDLTNNSITSIAEHYCYADVLVKYNSSIWFFVVRLQGGVTVVTTQNVPGQALAAA